MIRAFADEVKKLEKRSIKAGRAPKITLATGALAAPSLRALADVLRQKNIADARVAEIKNTFWGGKRFPARASSWAPNSSRNSRTKTWAKCYFSRRTP